MTAFDGFPKQLPEFFRDLKANNTKEWFEKNKKRYEAVVKVPSQEFVSALGAQLKKLCPKINAIPKVNKSLFRLNRDTRFSKDKTPYKTNLGILFWDGPGKRMESSGFYFHLEENMLMLGNGMYIFTKPAMEKFRRAVANKKTAGRLEKTIGKVETAGYSIGTKHYKRIPRGFDVTTPFQEEYLLYNGLTARIEQTIPEELFTSAAVDFVMTHFNGMYPLHQWLVDNI